MRDAVLERWRTVQIRASASQALRLLEPVRADSSVRAVLQKLAENDPNQYIQSQARNVLAQTSGID